MRCQTGYFNVYDLLDDVPKVIPEGLKGREKPKIKATIEQVSHVITLNWLSIIHEHIQHGNSSYAPA